MESWSSMCITRSRWCGRYMGRSKSGTLVHVALQGRAVCVLHHFCRVTHSSLSGSPLMIASYLRGIGIGASDWIRVILLAFRQTFPALWLPRHRFILGATVLLEFSFWIHPRLQVLSPKDGWILEYSYPLSLSKLLGVWEKLAIQKPMVSTIIKGDVVAKAKCDLRYLGPWRLGKRTIPTGWNPSTSY